MRRLAALTLLAALLVPAARPLSAGIERSEPAEHGHPGCPWKGGGPCPHGHDMDVAGPTVTACPADHEETPAQVGSIVAFPPVPRASLDVRSRGEPDASGRDASGLVHVPSRPEPPPPRATSPA